MGLATINIRIDEKDKKEFNDLCNELGLNMTTAFNMFVKSMIRTGGLPFEAKINNYNPETIKAIKEAEIIAKDSTAPTYSNAEEAFKSVLGEDY